MSQYRSVGLPSFLINYFGQKRIGKRLFLAENGSIKKIFQAKRGPNRPKTGKTEKNVAKTKFFNIVLAETDRLKKYFRRPKRRQSDTTVCT
jgi:hypothetical protein